MEISLHKTTQDFQFKAENKTASVDICASEKLTPNGEGFRPTELLLAGLGGCLSIDIQNILTKQRAPLKKFSMKISGEREEEIPHVFKSIQVEIELDEKLDISKTLKAVKLATDKYCTVYKILSATSKINITYRLI